MKPIKLVLNAFGSFLETTEIDFTVLNNSGFYLITGATGSGKTTIFDAIMFALYGEASGDVRSSEGFRSDFAEDKNPTYVEFTFEKDNIIYKITRSPRYSVEYRTTPIESKVSLVYEQHIIEKTTNVAEAINEILGLTADQFKQVIMLAQGEFMKLIHAKSIERDEIFRKIFGTEIFEKVSKLLKQETKDVKDKLKLNEELIKRLIISIPNYESYQNYLPVVTDLYNTSFLIEEIDSNINLSKNLIIENEEKLSVLSNELINLNTERETAKLINEDFNTLKLETDKLQQLEDKKDTIKLKTKQIDILNEVSKVKPLYDKLININLQVNTLVRTYETNVAILEEKQETLNFFIDQTNMIEIDRLSLKNLLKAKEEIENNIKLKQEIETHLTKITTIRQELIKLKDELDNLINEKKIVIQNIEDINLTIKELSKYQLEHDITLNKIKIQEESIKEFDKNKTLFEEANALNHKLKESIEKYQQYVTTYENAHAKYLSLENSYFKNIAGVLAKELCDGTPCPVCGSKTHPNPASVSGETISKEELDKMFAEVEGYRIIKDEQLIKIETIKAKYNSIIKQLLDNLKINDETIISDTISKISNEYNETLTNLNNYLNECLNKLKELTDLEQTKQTYEQKLIDIENENIKLTKSVDELNNKISLTEGSVAALEAQLTFSNPIDELIIAKEERAEAILMLEEAISGFDKEHTLAKEEHQLIKGKVEENLNQLTILKAEQDKIIKEYNEFIEKESISKEILDNIEIYIADLVNLSTYVKEVTEYESIYKTCKKQVNDLLKKLKDKQQQNIEEFDELIIVKEQAISSLKESLTNLNNIYNKQIQVSSELTIAYTEYKELCKLHDDLSSMSLVASGQNKKYLSFERYVLVEYFDNILNHANIRLKKMTNGRFMLYRKVDKTKGRAQQGLDMEIFDFETGKRRDVKTLSGGETFKAALSLALGLADAIENKVGNITIDTLFIDEGFGTLDEESLHQAIEILLELNSDNKSIGIISHVQELKDIIPTKLIVTKSDNGSSVKIVE